MAKREVVDLREIGDRVLYEEGSWRILQIERWDTSNIQHNCLYEWGGILGKDHGRRTCHHCDKYVPSTILTMFNLLNM